MKTMTWFNNYFETHTKGNLDAVWLLKPILIGRIKLLTEKGFLNEMAKL